MINFIEIEIATGFKNEKFRPILLNVSCIRAIIPHNDEWCRIVMIDGNDQDCYYLANKPYKYFVDLLQENAIILRHLSPVNDPYNATYEND
jgi:hypothetical protein